MCLGCDRLRQRFAIATARDGSDVSHIVGVSVSERVVRAKSEPPKCRYVTGTVIEVSGGELLVDWVF
jgi:hypothetical protein